MSNLPQRKENIKLERIAVHYPHITVVESYDALLLIEYERAGWRSHRYNNTIHLLHPRAPYSGRH